MFARSLGLVAALSLTVTPITAQAASYGSTLSGKTHVERAIGKCAGSLLLGALLGAGIGAAAGNTKKGVLIGLGTGAVVCALLISAASSKDKQALREAQLDAYNTGQVRNISWATEQGQFAQATIEPSKPGVVLVSQSGSLECRRQDDFCKVGDSWFPRASILAGQAAPDAPKLVKAAFTNAEELVCRRAHVSLTIDQNSATDGDDVACLVGDTWVTGDQLKKRKINESHVRI